MNFKPILFNTEMVQAILDGRKTQTRRIIKSRHESGRFAICKNIDGQVEQICSLGWDEENVEKDIICPYGHPGDALWVRETWQITDFLHPEDENYGYIYKASENGRAWENNDDEWKWKPSIHMPKEACRLFLKIKDIRLERLQDISEEDAIAEGVEKIADYGNTGYKLYTEPDAAYSDIDAVYSFESLWQSLNGPDSWEANPWVWVISFKCIDKPENFK